MYQFRLLSISYETTDINVRENFSLNAEQISFLLKDCKSILGLDELLILSTCNRTELLFASENDVDDIRAITNETMTRKNGSISAVEKILICSLDEFESWMQEHRNMEAIRNLKAALLTYKEQELSRLQKQMNSKSPEQYHLLMNAFIQKIIKNSAITLKSLKTQEERVKYSQMISQTFLR